MAPTFVAPIGETAGVNKRKADDDEGEGGKEDGSTSPAKQARVSTDDNAVPPDVTPQLYKSNPQGLCLGGSGCRTGVREFVCDSSFSLFPLEQFAVYDDSISPA